MKISVTNLQRNNFIDMAKSGIEFTLITFMYIIRIHIAQVSIKLQCIIFELTVKGYSYKILKFAYRQLNKISELDPKFMHLKINRNRYIILL